MNISSRQRWLFLQTIYNETYRKLIQVLVKARKDGGLTQQQIADKLDKPQSFIAKIEGFERKLDVLEYIEICAILGINAGDTINSVC